MKTTKLCLMLYSDTTSKTRGDLMAKKISDKKSEKELANEKSERIMQGIAIWTGFYRSNPQRFVKDYLNVSLKLFQKILLYAMMHNNFFMYIAARGQGL